MVDTFIYSPHPHCLGDHPMFDFTPYYPIIGLILSNISTGLFGAMKYYQNTLGNNPESFEIEKFAPIAILGIVISVGMLLVGTPMDAVQIGEFIGVNFFLVVVFNTIYTILKKKYFPGGLLAV
jgi:uncharacterized membrane protein YiaA